MLTSPTNNYSLNMSQSSGPNPIAQSTTPISDISVASSENTPHTPQEERIREIASRWSHLPPLFTEKISSSRDLAILESTLHSWKELTCETPHTKLFESCLIISRLMARVIDDLDEPEKAYSIPECSFHVAKDEKAGLQGALLLYYGVKVKTPSSEWVPIPPYIHLICTAPRNLPGSPNRIEGIGSALIETAIQESIKKGYGGAVSLESFPEALDFYTKLGFQKASWLPEEKTNIPMELSEERARQFMTSHWAGRAKREL